MEDECDLPMLGSVDRVRALVLKLRTEDDVYIKASLYSEILNHLDQVEIELKRWDPFEMDLMS